MEIAFFIDTTYNEEELNSIKFYIIDTCGLVFNQTDNVLVRIYTYTFNDTATDGQIKYLSNEYGDSEFNNIIDIENTLNDLTNIPSTYNQFSYIFQYISNNIDTKGDELYQNYSSKNLAFIFSNSDYELKNTYNTLGVSGLVNKIHIAELPNYESVFEEHNIDLSFIFNEEDINSYSNAIGNIEDTLINPLNGITITFNNECSNIIYEHIKPYLSDFSLTWEEIDTLVGKVKLKDKITLDYYKASNGETTNTNNFVDTDDDGLYDYEEINFDIADFITFDENGNVILPSYEELFELTGISIEGYNQLLEYFKDRADILEEINNCVVLPTYCSVDIPDTDGDGLDDLDEMDFGTSLLSIDTDNDGLDDLMEYDLGFNPFETNIDGDTYNDYEEYLKNLDPFIYDQTPDEFRESVGLGFAYGDFNEYAVEIGLMTEDQIDSGGYLVGHILSGFLGFGDIRDFFGCTGKEDWFGMSFSALGIVPIAGDVVKVSSKAKSLIKSAENVSGNGINFKECKNILYTFRYFIKKSSNYDFVKAVDEEIFKHFSNYSKSINILDKYIDNDSIAYLLLRNNNLDIITKYINNNQLKLAEENMNYNDVMSKVNKFWKRGLTGNNLTEALGMESAIKKYTDEGYELIYAQRKGENVSNGLHGPDIIMKKGNDVLIVEAKGTAVSNYVSELNDGAMKGTKLSSPVGDKNNFISYLSDEWFTNNADGRYLNTLRSLANSNVDYGLGCNYLEAIDILNDIIQQGGKYNLNLSVVFVGTSMDSMPELGAKISDYVQEIFDNKIATPEHLDIMKITLID